MPERRGMVTTSHPIVLTFLILAIIAFMSYAAEVLKPLAFAVLLSFALAPLSRFFHRWGIPRTPAAALTVLIALALLGVLGYQVGQQLTTMMEKLPTYERNLIARLKRVQPKTEGVFEKTTKVVHDVTQTLSNPEAPKDQSAAPEDESREKTVPVRIVSERSLDVWLGELFGPTLEYIGSGAFVLILVFFLLINREDLTERLIRLAGTRRISVTTKTMEEVDQRISRYLMTFATVNSTVGLVVAIGLRLIGVEYAVLWGVLAALLRFIPYVGPGTAFLLPFAFSIASAPGADWRQPLLVLGLFASIEVLANSYLEPVIYGKTTGVSSFGLLVAAMFWTWLWGAIGLLLSTPLTVCLAVIGKYVPGLQAFAILLGEDPPLTPGIQFYQRLMAMDQDGATELIDEMLKKRPRAEVFDEVLVPTLSRAERDFSRGDIDEREQAFIWRVIDDLLTELAETPTYDLKSTATAEDTKNNPGAPAVVDHGDVKILGIPANDLSDTLALRMLSVLLKPAGLTLTILEDLGTPLKLADHVAECKPALVVLSHVPPGGLTKARYVVRRIRSQSNDLPLIVGRWGIPSNVGKVTDQLKAGGATGAVFRLSEARDRIAAQFHVQDNTIGAPAVASMPTSAAVAARR
ncbi:MAG: AI-2E family transporter [Isosphaeraceae bacterium]|nr:AI-2E family transporter [Isosphaeraceae bacterium]